MKFRRRLRSRLIVSFGLFGALLSALFAVSTLLLQSWLEDALIARTLADEVDQYVQDLRIDPTIVEPFYTRIQGYVTRPGRADIVPDEFRELPGGVHDVITDLGVFKAAVAKEDDFWVFLTYDISDNRELSRRLLLALIAAVLFFSLLSLALGVWSAGRVMAPVTALARRVEALDETSESASLKKHFPDDEVGQLAAALDDYSHRLHELVERDKAFNADVSHELRTPLAVISGATELMLAQDDLSERHRDRLQRVARAARQSADITTALLHLVRSERGGTGSWPAQDVAAISEQMLENYRPLVSDRDLKLELEVQDELSVIAPDSVLAVILANLVGNAVRYTATGSVRVSVQRGQVVILDTGPGIPEEELPRVFERHFRGRQSGGSKGSGLGLSIVRRLVDLYGWSIDFANRESGGLAVTVRFFPDLDEN